MQKTELIDKIQEYMKAHMDEKRYEHSQRVAETAIKLCNRYGENPEAGYLAGLSHDMCKQLSDKEIKKLAKKDGLPISLIEKEKPSLLHGRAAASLLDDVFFSKSFMANDTEVYAKKEQILEAVRWHTFGKDGLSALAKIIYIADKIEPGRSYEAKSLLNEIDNLSLDDLVLNVIKDAIAYLERKKKDIALATLRFYEELISNSLADYAV